MSPETLHSGQHTGKSDIWALGITLYQMIFTYFPWFAKNEKDLYDKIIS